MGLLARVRFLAWVCVIPAALGAAGCASPSRVADDLAGKGGLIQRTVASGRFDIRTAERITDASAPLVAYIEGDGYAWISPTRPSSDPTPKDPLALHLASVDPSPNVLWLARPCQYSGGDKARGCSVTYWTDARFAAEVVQSLSTVIDQAKARSGASRVRLVGYSGGGTVAALLAARRNDIDLLVTVAGILDVAAWTKMEGLTPLDRSLDSADQSQQLAGLRQIHFVGVNDRTVPPAVARSFAARFPPGRRPSVVEIPGFDHSCCWAENWRGLRARAEQEARVP